MVNGQKGYKPYKKYAGPEAWNPLHQDRDTKPNWVNGGAGKSISKTTISLLKQVNPIFYIARKTENEIPTVQQIASQYGVDINEISIELDHNEKE